MNSNGESVTLDGRTLSLEAVERVARQHVRVGLQVGALERMRDSRAVVDRALEAGQVVYGVTTGFGALSETLIEPRRVRALQVNLIRSHSVGTGGPLPEDVVRAMMLLRANTLAGGHCGVRPEVCQLLVDLLNENVYPNVPEQGSVGASGDLAPLAHLAALMIGEGRAMVDERWVDGGEALASRGLKPLVLEAKEGLALINGTQLMTAIGILAVLDGEELVETADLAGALTVEAIRGTRVAFRESIHRVRPHAGQIRSAARLRELLGDDSEISRSHADCGKVQDLYSVRCMPQVHGAARDTLSHARSVLEIEVNSATDNPLVFTDDGDSEQASILSGGNFHGAPIAAVLDFMAISLADLASISERRVAALLDPEFSGLPVFLTSDPGVNSGFMMYQVAAAALVSENKVLAHPASVDSVPTSANKEDHVSMGAWAGRKLWRILENCQRVISIELIAAAQGIDLLRPLRSSPALERAHSRLRDSVPMLNEDRPGSKDIELVAELVRQGALLD